VEDVIYGRHYQVRYGELVLLVVKCSNAVLYMTQLVSCGNWQCLSARTRVINDDGTIGFVQSL
jgi:hypothetical protein